MLMRLRPSVTEQAKQTERRLSVSKKPEMRRLKIWTGKLNLKYLHKYISGSLVWSRRKKTPCGHRIKGTVSTENCDCC